MSEPLLRPLSTISLQNGSQQKCRNQFHFVTILVDDEILFSHSPCFFLFFYTFMHSTISFFNETQRATAFTSNKIFPLMGRDPYPALSTALMAIYHFQTLSSMDLYAGVHPFLQSLLLARSSASPAARAMIAVEATTRFSWAWRWFESGLWTPSVLLCRCSHF